MKNILLFLFLLSTTLIYSQSTSRRFPTGKVIHTQTGAGAGYYDVSCNFIDEGGLFDGTTVTTGDYLFISDGGYGYYLPIISVLSSGYSTVIVRVDHTGLPIGSVPVGVGYISKGSDHFKLFPFVSGLSNANQQINIEETLSNIDSILQYKLPERTSGSSAPVYTPGSDDSWLAQNGAGSLYFFNGSTWTLVGTGSGTSDQPCLDTIVITGITPTCVVGTPMIRKTLNTWDNISGHVITDIPVGIVIKKLGTDTAIVAYCGAYPTSLSQGSYYADSISTSGYTTTPTGSITRPVFLVDANGYLKVNTGFGFQSSSSSSTVYTNTPLTGDGSSGDPVRIDDASIGVETFMYWDGSIWTTGVPQTDATLGGSGTGSDPFKIAQQGATTGQALVWNGGDWAPGTITGATNLTFTGTGPYTLNSSTGSDVTITQGTGMSLVRTSNDLTFNLANTAVSAGSYGVSGYPVITIDAQGRITFAVDQPLPDGSNTNEGTLGVSAGSSLNSLITSNTSGASGVTISVGSAGVGLSISETTSSNGGTITLALSDDVAAIEALTSTGFLVRTASNTWAQRSLVAGTGISITNTSGLAGNPTITNTGDTDASNDITTSTSAGGDLTGTYPNPTINIDKVDSTKVINFGLSVLDLGANGATTGQVLKFNGTQWAPGTDNAGSGATDLTFTGSSSPVTLNSSSGTDVTLTAGTNISFSQTSNNLTINGPTLRYQTINGDGVAAIQETYLDFISSADLDAQVTDDGGTLATQVTFDIPTGAVDYSEIQVVTGARLLGNPSGTTSSATEIPLGTGLGFSTGQLINTGDTNGSDDITTSTSAGGDLTGTYPNPTININKIDSTKVINFGLSVRDIGASSATSGQYLVYNGTQWAPTTLSISGQLSFIEGVAASTVDLDANVGNVKDKDGNNVAFTIPTNTYQLRVFKNGIRLSESGSITTRDYSVNTSTHVITFTTALVSTDRIIIEK